MKVIPETSAIVRYNTAVTDVLPNCDRLVSPIAGDVFTATTTNDGGIS